jgi:hypothetical protein
MADIDLLIKIPEELYEAYKDRPPLLGDTGMDIIAQSIANGVPLPTEHGKIGDLTAVMNDITQSIEQMTNIGIAVDGEYLWGKLNDAIYNAQTLIESNREIEK